jgi:hypothetical protein
MACKIYQQYSEHIDAIPLGRDRLANRTGEGIQAGNRRLNLILERDAH